MLNQKLSELEEKIGKVGSLYSYGLIGNLSTLGTIAAFHEGHYFTAGVFSLFVIGSLYYNRKKHIELCNAFKDYKNSL